MILGTTMGMLNFHGFLVMRPNLLECRDARTTHEASVNCPASMGVLLEPLVPGNRLVQPLARDLYQLWRRSTKVAIAQMAPDFCGPTLGSPSQLTGYNWESPCGSLCPIALEDAICHICLLQPIMGKWYLARGSIISYFLLSVIYLPCD